MLQKWLSTVFLSGSKPTSRRNKINLVSLPAEVLLEIFKYLSFWDLNIRIQGICKRFHDIISEERAIHASKLTLQLPQRRKFPPNVAPWANSAFERTNYIANPELSSLICSYSKYKGLACRLRDCTMLLGKTSTRTSRFLLEPVMVPPVQRIWLHINPGTFGSPVKVDGNRIFATKWGQARAVTIIDLIDWIARYVLEENQIYKCFRVSLRGDRIAPRRDGSVDAHVYIHLVGSPTNVM